MARECFERIVGEQPVFLSRFTQMELLQGCRDEREWVLLQAHLREQDYAELSEHTWQEAARIYYDLRRRGLTVRSSIDCCIAQLAIDRRLALLHSDRDFEAIQQVRVLSCVRFSFE
ncbi:PIN domain-containing protein [Gloeobacter morelensis MG652769]|uniref:PIN domain-containing protein n=1 Tax=Gloeobacter morelensis MG652769 TaxID=2781736 RepID=A0ABY3PQU9_9CYAN|nr:PIN domain-containing protein [Gloeobacter morelensis]UFP96088.1 PIN domain-containing protein [Gloeobacter morelensis MG652769]